MLGHQAAGIMSGVHRVELVDLYVKNCKSFANIPGLRTNGPGASDVLSRYPSVSSWSQSLAIAKTCRTYRELLHLSDSPVHSCRLGGHL